MLIHIKELYRQIRVYQEASTMATATAAVHKAMQTMSLQPVDGINYLAFGFEVNIPKQLQLIRDLELRDDDVICVGYPRAGNHWIFEIVSMILRQETQFTDRLIYSVMMELMGDGINEKVQKMASPRYLNTHHRIYRLPVQAVDKRIKLIYLVRNPKDIYVSMYRLLSNFKDDTYSFKGSWDEFFELQMAGEIPWGPWFEHVLAMDTFMKENPECPVHVCSFEKLKQDPVKGIKQLCSFLGKPDSLAEEIARVTEFTNMKVTLGKGKMQMEEKIVNEGSDVMLRKGETGGWKDYFTVAQNERFNKVFQEKMTGSKLAELVREYL